MYRNGRPEDQCFLPEEKLFLRFQVVSDDGKVDVSQIKFYGQSVNREKYSKPYYILFPNFFHWGYGYLHVREIPDDIRGGDGIPIKFKVEHEPLEENYSHSSIYPYKSGKQYNPSRGRKIKLEYRTKMREKIRILKNPD